MSVSADGKPPREDVTALHGTGADRRSRIAPWLITISASALIALICWADHLTGPDLGLSLFYLIPVAISGWYCRRAAAVTVAVLAAGAWTFADLAWAEDELSMIISGWNAFTRLVIYTGGALLLAEIRLDRERLTQMARREAALARTDGTTNLLNVRGFLEAADRVISGPRGPLTLVYFDLDNFKKFNDQLGHAAGDAILMEVGRVLRSRAGEHDPVARMGGDEFAVLLAGRDHASSRQWASEAVDEIRAIGAPYPAVAFGATAGVAVYSDPPADAEKMIREADDAMYRGKTAQRGSVVLITPAGSGAE